MKKIIFLSSVLAITLFACKKNNNATTPAPTTYTKADTLQNGKWKLESATAGGGFLDLTTSMKECQKDNLYTFNSDKTITVDEGATKCAATDISPRSDGNWALLNNNTQISVSGSLVTSLGISSLTGDIISLNSSTLELKKDTTISGFPTTINIRFSNVK